jgi:hypothetical protein
MDPQYTFGLRWTWSPQNSGPLSAIRKYVQLRPDPQLQKGCVWYISEPGDYAARIAQRVGVAAGQLLVDNYDLFKLTPGDFLPIKTKVKICNPDPGEKYAAARLLVLAQHWRCLPSPHLATLRA